jgi:phage gp36-like protein
MSIAVVATTKFAGASGGTTSALDTTGANAIAVWMAYGGSPTLTDNKGNTYTAGTAGGSVLGRWYYCLNAVVGTGHTWTVGGGSTASSIVVYALSGVATSAAYSSPGTIEINANPATFRVDATPPEANCLVLMGMALSTTTLTSVTPSSGWSTPQWTSGVGGTNYGSTVAHQIQTTQRTVLATEPLATLGGNPGGAITAAFFKAATVTDSLTITSPSAFEVHQRSTSTTGSIQIGFSTVGSTEDIEASHSGSAFQTIKTGHAPGAGTGTYTGPVGQGTLTVRKKTTTTSSATVANVGIGIVLTDGGDSIDDGRGTNAQVYSHATLKAAMFRGGVWSELTETNGAGSHRPLLATQIMADQGVPVAFIVNGVGSTDVAGSNNQWAKPNSAYSALTSAVTASTVSSVPAVMMHLGPNAVINATLLSKATYNAAIDTLASNYAADLAGAPTLHIGVFGEVSTGSPPDRVSALNNLRGAILEALGDNANVKPGPCLIELDYSDGVHPTTDAQLQAVAHRWWFALKESLFGGSAGSGRGPRLASASWNIARTQLTVVFDRVLKTGLTHATACWAVSDNGSAMTVSSVAYHGSNASALVITTSAAATGPANSTTLTFANGDTAVGQVVPRSADLTLPAGGTTTIPAEPFYAAAVSEGVTSATMTPAAGAALASFAAAAFAVGGFAASSLATASFSGTAFAGATVTPAAGASLAAGVGSSVAVGTFGAAAGTATVGFNSGAASLIVTAQGTSTAAFSGASVLTSAMTAAVGQSAASFSGDSSTGSFMAVAPGASSASFAGSAVAETAAVSVAGSSTTVFAGVGPAPSGDWLMYATEADMVARFGADEMSMLAEGSDVIQALRDASEEAQSYTAVRYTPPLPNVPAPLVSATCDIARYRLYKDRATEQVKERYEAQIKWLTRLADGKAVLTFSPALTPEQAEVIEKPVAPSSGMATQGVFGDDVLGMMPDVRRGSYW